jgi:hypothetical protein
MAQSERYNIDLVGMTTVNVANPKKPGAGMGMETKSGGFKGEKGGKHDKAVKHGDTGKSKGRAVTPARPGGGGGGKKKP